jgi:hypothetical protein
MRRGPQPDLVRRHVHRPIEGVGGAVPERYADRHAAFL